ncbi:hypothetical protein [Actinomadura chokoriensis]|uniref:hypothetical protein n=1 Tax=Actinomadura chokoriensis TaxID=454156 RepID=UPI0031F7463E
MVHSPEPAADVFIELLRRLREEAGRPGWTALSKASDKELPTSSIWDVLSGKRRKVPRWGFVFPFLVACRKIAAETGLDPESLGNRELWLDLHRRAMRGGLVAAGLDLPDYLRGAFPDELADVPHESLRLGRRTGDLWQVESHPGYAYKDYGGRSPDAGALSELLAFPGRLSARSRDIVAAATAWPSARVFRGGSVSGVLIPVPPEEFFVVGEGRLSPQDMSYLVKKPIPAWSRIGLRLPGTLERIELLKEFARLLDLLHEGGVQVGDIHEGRVLWTLGSVPRVLLLDCDAFRTPSGASVLPRTATPGWEAPEGEDADRYQLAVLIGRVLALDPRLRPGEGLVLPDNTPDGIAERVAECFEAAATAHERDRPDAGRWEEALSFSAPASIWGPMPESSSERGQRLPPAPRDPDPRDVMPFYLVCDESAGMAESAGRFLGDAVARIREAAAGDPVAAQRVRFGVVAFNKETSVLMELGPLETAGGGAPRLRGFGDVRLGDAFAVLRDVISQDMRSLRDDGLLPYRPTIFLLMAAEPRDADWPEAYYRLTDPSFVARPAIVSIGLSSVSRYVVETTGSAAAFLTADTRGDKRALQGMGDFLARSMLESARHLGSSTRPGGSLLVPDRWPGLIDLTAPRISGYTAVPLDRAFPRRTSGPGRVLPLYLLCEESGAMAGEPMAALNEALPKLVNEIRSAPALAAAVRFSLVGFNDSPTPLLGSVDLLVLRRIPGFEAYGGTRFGPVFEFLTERIAKDVEDFRAAGNDVHRPAVIFVAGNEPRDDWTDAYERLAGPQTAYRPNILAIGFGAVRTETLSRVATIGAFEWGRLDPAMSVREFASSFVRSVVAHRTVPPDDAPDSSALRADLI